MKALTLSQEHSLTTANKNIVKISNRFGWKPQTAIIRIQRALPAILEQQIYLAVASDFAIHPESMAKLLRMYLGFQELKLEDLNPHPIGENLVSSKFACFAEFLRECLNLLKVTTNEYSALGLSVLQVGYIVLHYGTENPQLLIEMIDTNLDELCEVLEINSRHTYSHKMRLCIWLIVNKIIPDNRKRGFTDPLDISEILEMPKCRRNQLRHTLSQDLPDYLSANFDELRCCNDCEILKKEGII